MEGFLSQSFERLLDNTDLSFKRYLYREFKPGRLTALVGPRGVGKTTLLLQYIKENFSKNNKAFYFSADSVYFQQTTLLGFINDLYNIEGYRVFFIDEIHKYVNWNQELKNLYDSFPDIKIIYSGSSALELTKGGYDLSRRVKLYHLPGLSFREYLNFVAHCDVQPITFSDLLSYSKSEKKLSSIEKLMAHFKQYLAYGYYPFSFEDKNNYFNRVIRVIDKIIFEDIPNYFDLKTQNLYLFKKILSYLASISPGEVNTHNIAQNMQVSHQTIFHYLSILSEVGLIQMIYPMEGGNQYLRKPQKIFLHNTTLLYALQQFVGEALNVGTLRELYFIQALRDANHNIYYSKQGDYCTKDIIFEIGGKNKKATQLASIETRGILVKDDIVVATRDVIPLLFFGFLY
ncbi:MAG: ATPase [Gammaproteobacteria bacterium RIFCSPHIGHO2_12_FULL_38_11]|nr:MAG: ATPase [Gammaproteobacteria bacterium RIFCSPHIGHO2_12_FULL_38_11]